MAKSPRPPVSSTSYGPEGAASGEAEGRGQSPSGMRSRYRPGDIVRPSVKGRGPDGRNLGRVIAVNHLREGGCRVQVNWSPRTEHEQAVTQWWPSSDLRRYDGGQS